MLAGVRGGRFPLRCLGGNCVQGEGQLPRKRFSRKCLDVSGPLFLQIKEARKSVLEPYAGKSVYANHGQRVVVGRRLTQPASDIFLGWTQTDRSHFYLRQLRDMKFNLIIETMNSVTLRDYGVLCGWTLARAHVKSGDAVRISGNLGKKPVFDEAVGPSRRATPTRTRKTTQRW